jgi:hypothetical protein
MTVGKNWLLSVVIVLTNTILSHLKRFFSVSIVSGYGLDDRAIEA